MFPKLNTPRRSRVSHACLIKVSAKSGRHLLCHQAKQNGVLRKGNGAMNTSATPYDSHDAACSDSSEG